MKRKTFESYLNLKYNLIKLAKSSEYTIYAKFLKNREILENRIQPIPWNCFGKNFGSRAVDIQFTSSQKNLKANWVYNIVTKFWTIPFNVQFLAQGTKQSRFTEWFNQFPKIEYRKWVSSKSIGIQFQWNQKHLKADSIHNSIPENQLNQMRTRILAVHANQVIFQKQISNVCMTKKICILWLSTMLCTISQFQWFIHICHMYSIN